MARFIGIRHRVKFSRDGEARPTLVAIRDGEATKIFELDDDTAELDFALGRFPIAWRELERDEDPDAFPPHHVKERKKAGKTKPVVRVPSDFDGLRSGDTVAMTLGGSGDRFAYALARRAEEIGARVLRTPPFILKDRRNSRTKEDDHLTLASLGESHPELFYLTGPRDRDLIALREAYRTRRDAQKDRIRCEQRFLQRAIGQVFLSSEGKYPEGAIEDAALAAKASDVILRNLLSEEAKRETELRAAMVRLDVWRELLKEVEGCGEVIAAGVIAPIGDIRRFATDSKLKAYCGAHVLADGRFPRQRSGAVANWSGEARQALYQLGIQFVYRPDSHWGQRLRQYKQNLRAKHPEVVEVNGKKRYTDAHIHKMAIWRALSRFVEWFHREWTALEMRHREEVKLS